MMVAWQIINKVLETKDYSIIENNMLDVDYFSGFEDEFKFIQNHYTKYGNVPDIPTFLSNFPDSEMVEVTESDKYLVNTIREEYLYNKSVPVVQKFANLLKVDSNLAAEYIMASTKELQPNYDLGGTDIINGANDRYNQYLQRKENPNEWCFTTGFEELDDLIHGLQRGEELLAIVARTNQGKSWVLEKICVHVWELGFNIGYISPEMGANNIGYRFDTLTSNFSNKGLVWANKDVDVEGYKKYIDDLKNRKNRFMVANSQDFGNSITVSKLRNWIKQYKLDLLAVDGITYLDDMRYRRGDSKTVSLTNISEDLMALSVEMGIPVIVVVQANRGGVVDKDSNDTPELESIRDSDGIAHNASKVLSIRQNKDGMLIMKVLKNRIGMVGGKLMYQWDVNKGIFTYVPNYEDAQPKEQTERKIRKQTQNKEDVF